MKILASFIFSLTLCSSLWAATQKQITDDIKHTMGVVPRFMKDYPAASLQGAWNEFKNLHFDENGLMEKKYRNLAQVAVASLMNCKSCLYFYKEMARTNKATDQEIAEALAIAGQVNKLSSFMDMVYPDVISFVGDVQQMRMFLARRDGPNTNQQVNPWFPPQGQQLNQGYQGFQQPGNMAPLGMQQMPNTSTMQGAGSMQAQEASGGNQPLPSSGEFVSDSVVLQDMMNHFGFGPQFFRLYPVRAVGSLWNNFKTLELNDKTAIPRKYKNLIGLAASLQANSGHWRIYHTSMANYHGASMGELMETMAVTGQTRQWGIMMNALDDENKFRGEVRQMMKYINERNEKRVTKNSDALAN